LERETLEQTLERFTGMFKECSLWRDDYEPYLGKFFSFFCAICKGSNFKIHPSAFTEETFQGWLELFGYILPNLYEGFSRPEAPPKKLTSEEQASIDWEVEYFELLEAETFQEFRLRFNSFTKAFGIYENNHQNKNLWAKLLKHMKRNGASKYDNVDLLWWMIENCEVSSETMVLAAEVARTGKKYNNLTGRHNQEYIQESVNYMLSNSTQ
jgi:hypothetical protein